VRPSSAAGRAPETALADLRCEATATFANGTLELAGHGTARESGFNLRVAITGGTGIYDEIHGQGRFDGEFLVLDIDA